MAALTIALRPQSEQTGFNLRRWSELVADPALARIEGRIETDRHGRIIMSPPPAPQHGYLQSEIARLLGNLMPHGRTVAECPISTADGVKAADVAWASAERWHELGNKSCFSRAPQICVEVLSPGNTEAEIQEKAALYFDSGAEEVWLCSLFGAMSYLGPGPALLDTSRLCPNFPERIIRPISDND